jgi:hypothetical protein
MAEQNALPEAETIEDAWYALGAIREALELYLPRTMMRSADDTPSTLSTEAAELVRGVHALGRMLAPEDDAENR